MTDLFKTNDMGLTAYLTLNGQKCQGDEWQENTCYWLFPLNPALSELVELWISHQARVEPISYNRVFDRFKKDLLSVLRSVRD